MSDHRQLHAIISGQVQGVYFRYHTRKTAHALQLTGWVRNLPNGKVEVIAEGTIEQLEQLHSFLYNGSPGAKVTSVDTEWWTFTGQFTSFTIKD